MSINTVVKNESFVDDFTSLATSKTAIGVAHAGLLTNSCVRNLHPDISVFDSDVIKSILRGNGIPLVVEMHCVRRESIQVSIKTHDIN